MKNILAENMLRFGVKNLSANSKKKLTIDFIDEQTQPQTGMTSTTLQKKFPNVAKWLNAAVAAASTNTTPMCSTIDNIYLVTYMPTTSEAASGNGIFNMYRLTSSNGWPILQQQYRMTNNLGKKWANNQTIESGANITLDKIPGDFYSQKFNNFWLNPEAFNDPIIKGKLGNYNKCITQLISANSKNLKTTFITNNSTYPGPNNTRIPYSSEIGKVARFQDSQYYRTYDKNITDPTAKIVYDLIKDTQLIAGLSSGIKPVTPKAN